MGKKDIALKTYFSNSERFADFVNGAMLHGKTVLKAQDLNDIPPVHDKTSKTVVVERMSDVAMKQLSDGSIIALLFMQNQMKTDYGMPFRVLFNEALEYDRQYRKRQNENRKEWDKKMSPYNERAIAPTVEEYLSGIKKNDRFTPVITIIVYWGEDKWCGPKTLKELLDCSQLEKELWELVADYPINLVHIDELENLQCFNTDVRHLLNIRKRRNQREAYRQYIEENKQELVKLDMESAAAIAVMSDDKELLYLVEEGRNEEEEFDMCKALDDMRLEARQEGIQEGIKEIILKFFQSGMSIEKIAEIAGIPINDLENIVR